MDSPPTHLQGNVERFSGFADRYDAYRPTPPTIIVDILTQLAGTISHLVMQQRMMNCQPHAR